MPYTEEERLLLEKMPRGAAALRDGKKPGPKTSEVQIRDAGLDSMADAQLSWDAYDDEVDASFPASDPPSHQRPSTVPPVAISSEPAPTTAQLRNEIDRGLTGEKVAHPDPAAAPLGTDDEASGNPPTPIEREMARQPILRTPAKRPSAAFIYVALVAVISLAILATVLFARGGI